MNDGRFPACGKRHYSRKFIYDAVERIRCKIDLLHSPALEFACMVRLTAGSNDDARYPLPLLNCTHPREYRLRCRRRLYATAHALRFIRGSVRPAE